MYIFTMSKKNDTFYFHLSTADHIGVGMFKYSMYPRQKFIIVNSALAKMLGYNYKREIKEKEFKSFFASSREGERFFRELKENKKVSLFEARFKKSDGKKIWVGITALYIRQKNFEYMEGIVEDITAHRETEEKLFMERDYLRNLLDNIPDAVFFKDRQNRIIKVNKFYAKGMGLPPEEIIGKTDFDFFPPEQAQKMFDDDNYVLTTGKAIVGKIERTLLPDGTWNQVITTKIPMYDRRGNIIGTMGITRDMTAYANLERERLSMLLNGLNVLEKALAMRDPYTFGHTRNVATIVEAIARRLNWDENRSLGLKLAAQLHDLGKISIPLDILNKPGKLTPVEYMFIQEHVKRCYDLLKDISFPFPLADAIYQHHERMDGSGYPRRLSGKNIILEARILAVADVLEAITSRRPYREALGLDVARKELREGAGTRYDARIVRLVMDMLDDNGCVPFWLEHA